MPRVNLRFHPRNKDFVVKKIMESYAAEANTPIFSHEPNRATIVLPSMFVAEELQKEAELSLLCETSIDL